MKTLSSQWNGEPTEYSLPYMYTLNADQLVFRVLFSDGANGHPTAEPGMFTPELWKWDVAELFITGTGGKYVEINLSPNGAYWIQGFDDIRKESPEFEVAKLKISVKAGELRLDAVALEEYLGGSSGWRLNATAIMNAPDYVYLSEVKLSGIVPDFHQPADFSSIIK